MTGVQLFRIKGIVPKGAPVTLDVETHSGGVEEVKLYRDGTVVWSGTLVQLVRLVELAPPEHVAQAHAEAPYPDHGGCCPTCGTPAEVVCPWRSE